MKSLLTLIFMIGVVSCSGFVTKPKAAKVKFKTNRRYLLKKCIVELSVDNTLKDATSTCMQIYTRN